MVRRVRFIGETEEVQPAATEEAWGSDNEEEDKQQPHLQHAASLTPNHAQQGRQHQQHARLAREVLSQLPSSAVQQHGAAAATALSSYSAKGSQSSSFRTIPAAAMQQLLAQQQQQQQQLPSLQQLCVGVLGRHVTELVQQLEGHLGWLPADVKAGLLAVARRRGELTGPVLAALADAEWSQLDLAGCRRLNAAELLAVAHAMPRIRVLDVTGFEQLSAGGWKQLARAWPHLTVLRLGGTAAASSEALKALQHILPGILPPQAAAAASKAAVGSAAGGSSAAAVAAEADDALGNWEDAFASDSEQEGDDDNDITNASLQTSNTDVQHPGSWDVSSSRHVQQQAAAGDCRLKELRVLVWPDVPAEALELVQRRCPRVAVNPSLQRDVVSGQLPPPALDPAVALDAAAMAVVGPQALQDLPQDGCSSSQSGAAVISIADRFKAAYVEQAARLRDKERRLWKAQQRRQLRSSHALRTLNAWLDEPA